VGEFHRKHTQLFVAAWLQFQFLIAPRQLVMILNLPKVLQMLLIDGKQLWLTQRLVGESVILDFLPDVR
jgi:hypothetical protein